MLYRIIRITIRTTRTDRITVTIKIFTTTRPYSDYQDYEDNYRDDY